MWDEYTQGRGDSWDCDPGPPRNRSWLRLFAETPNYRAMGTGVTGREVFRWHFGPMFYRGRLRDGQVKVLVVGQEGAQDESLAHRAFTGGTGGRLQYLLHHLGITSSYLFLNTFVYPIFGQYRDEIRSLAQDPDSLISSHRNELFDYVVWRNDLQLAIAVGTAAKESLATWVRAHGGSADPARLDRADASVVSPHLRMVGVLHPGGASKGGAVAEIIADFKRAIRRIERWVDDDPGWLPPDAGAIRLPADDYRYRASPIPFREFPYGTTWRLGRSSTSSNRRDDQTAIQLFSDDGRYNQSSGVRYSGSTAGSIAGYRQESGDLAYEPPRRRYRDFDSGPPPAFARLLQGGDPGLAWPDFTHFGLKAHPSFGLGPVYRGRLERPSILVLGDQEGHDDLFLGRALCGEGGQRLQAFLRSAGLDHRYAILRVLPVDTLDDSPSRVRKAVEDPAVAAIYREAIRRSRPEVVLAMGPNAQFLAGEGVAGSVPVVEIEATQGAGSEADWRKALSKLKTMPYRRDLTSPTFDYRGEREQIPRVDLPFGTLRWQGSSGDRAVRARVTGAKTFDYYKLVMPAWAAALAPAPLTRSERRSVDSLT